MTQPPSSIPVLLARINDSQVGLAALAVREIVRAVAIVPLPGAPDIVEGAINLHGRIVPVVDVRRRLGLDAVALHPDQFLVSLDVGGRVIAVRVDDVEDVIELSAAALESPASVSPVLSGLQGVAATDAGALIVYDVDAFLTQAEHDALSLTEAGVA